MKPSAARCVTAVMYVVIFTVCGQAQEAIPGAGPLKTKEQLQRISEICDSLNRVEEYGKAQALARQTLAAVSPEDNKNLSLFNFYIGVGYQGVISDSAIFYYEKSLAFARLAKNNKRIVNALRELMYMYNYTDGYITQRDKTAAELNVVIDTTKNISLKKDCYSKLSDYYGVIGWREQELNYRLTELELSKTEMQKGVYKNSDADSTNLGVSYFNIGDLYEKMGHYTKAQEYYHLARPLLWNYKAGICSYYKGMATSYTKMGNTAFARQYADSLKSTVEQTFRINAGWNMLLDLYLSNADYYLNQQQPAAAMPYLKQAEGLVHTKVTEVIETGTFQYIMGKALVVQKNHTAALPYLLKAETVKEGFSAAVYADVLRTLATCYQGLGQWEHASRYYAKYLPLRDSLDAKAAQQSMANAEARYQNKEKAQEIAAQKAQISFAQKQRLWLMTGIAVLLLLATLLFLFYRNKKRNADALGKLNAALEEANKTKAKLFGIISHDLRSPINQVYQFLKLQQLNPRALNEQQQAELNDKIQNATGSLLETMEDLLIWSKTQMGAFKLNVQTVPIAETVNTCQKLLQLGSDAKQIRYDLRIPETITVQTDAYYLQTIIRNLLQNALKAAPLNSGIIMETTLRSNFVVLTIQNEGAAFTQAQFLQAFDYEDGAKSLTGFGLKLVHELSEKCGIQVSFSNPSENTTRAEIRIPQV